ncbi:MAG TPA: penicillin-binding transpeptidase domain-containing protein [Gaiellaceae bacterium]|nr:penicillin-binding transpeptidase domain-containing protein [Gaiellaceae bacterium]
MNRQISRISLIALLLLAALIVATTYWQAWAAPGLKAKQDNALERVAQFEIKRGLIYAADRKTALAANRTKKTAGQTLYLRRYPQAGLAAQVVGYSTQGRSRAGLERSQNAYLTASDANLGTIWDKLTADLSGATITGNNLILNILPGPQRIAESALAGNCGAAVVLNPKTGQVYVMASSPSYNPNLIESNSGFASILKAPSACPGSSSALLNRATQGLYAPGSTFKTITAATALDDHVYTVGSTFSDPGYCTEYGKKVYNALDQSGPEVFGSVDFQSAFEHSINAVFCNIGQKLGAQKIIDESKKWGFYSKPPIELPSDEVAPSGLLNFKTHKFFDDGSQVDPGRLAFGQERMLVTPLQMALVAAGVANGGTIMVPHLVQEVRTPSGSLVTKVKPKVWRHATSPQTAATLNQFMQAVVTGGTGTSAQIPGIKVAGKTGTAETGKPNVYTAWFIFFAPADNPQVAGAVVLENQLNGFGGSVSAPIAKQLMQAILQETSKH